MVLRCSDRISRVPPYLIRPIMLPIRGCHPLWPTFPGRSGHTHGSAGPRSLAATRGVSVDFLSSGYLDVSVPRVCSFNPMCSGQKYLVQQLIEWLAPTIRHCQVGCPIREIILGDPKPYSLAPPSLSQSYHVLSSPPCCQGIHQTALHRRLI